jgi:hypothetical protein
MFALPLTIRHVGTGSLEKELEELHFQRATRGSECNQR